MYGGWKNNEWKNNEGKGTEKEKQVKKFWIVTRGKEKAEKNENNKRKLRNRSGS